MVRERRNAAFMFRVATYALKEAIEDSVFPGPRLFLSVHALSQTGGHADIRVSP